MTRVSLKEAYDNKDVVQQIYAIRDTAEGAESIAIEAKNIAVALTDQVDEAVANANTASANANSASASAQASAQTVVGFDDRLTEDEELLGVLEVADEQNVKLTGTQDITGQKTLRNITTPSASDASTSAVNKAFVQDTSGLSNIAHVNANNKFAVSQDIAGDAKVSGKFMKTSAINRTVTPTGYQNFGDALVVGDSNQVSVASLRRDRDPNYDRMFLSLMRYVSSSRTDSASLDIRIEANGTVNLILRKTINGVTSQTTVASL